MKSVMSDPAKVTATLHKSDDPYKQSVKFPSVDGNDPVSGLEAHLLSRSLGEHNAHCHRRPSGLC
jgi:hypothetical protein